jgi:hypothetical protein
VVHVVITLTTCWRNPNAHKGWAHGLHPHWTMRSSVILTFAVVLLVTGHAEANPGFPNEIATHLKLACGAPDCTLCHSGDLGECGTIIRPFGKWLMSQGLTCADGGTVYNVSAIDPLLDQAASTELDSNCDGTPDIEQITMCDWQALEQDSCGADGGPTNAPPGNGAQPVENVIYGCSTAPAPLWPGVAGFGVAGALMTMVSRRRRKR